MTQAAAFWDAIAEKYARDPIGDVGAYEYTLDRTRSYLRPDDHVLELACGTASTALLLAPEVAEYDATDISPEMVRIGREKLAGSPIPGLSISVGGADLSGFDNGSFDVVMAFNALHLIPDVDAALRSIRSGVRDGGLFISKTPCLADMPGAAKRTAIRAAVPVMQWLGKAPKPVHFLRIAALEAAVTKAGFEIVEAGNFPAKAASRYIVARAV